MGVKLLHNPKAGSVLFHCPGCKCGHAVWIEKRHPNNNSIWGYNGNPEKPTFTPSILVRGTKRLTDDEAARIMAGEKITPVPFVCHSFVTDGKIQFLSDSTHELAGQTVEMPDWDEEVQEL